MHIKAAIKVALREMLNRKPNVQANISLLDSNAVIINFGKGWSYKLVTPEYNDEGDPCTQDEYDDIFGALSAIVDEHNAQIGG